MGLEENIGGGGGGGEATVEEYDDILAQLLEEQLQTTIPLTMMTWTLMRNCLWKSCREMKHLYKYKQHSNQNN